MPVRFLRSKTTPPTLHHQMVGRTRLLSSVSDAAGPLVLVSAPAGYGKTTLLVQALADVEGHVAWVTVDSADDDPLRFWTHVAAALLGDGEELAGTVADLAAGPDQRQLVIDRLLADIEQREGPVYLVLDDLHEVTSEEIIDALARVLISPPKNLTLVASTRSDPALPTGRLRAQGRLTEVRARELAFTTAEAAELFRGRADLDALESIVRQTEGWPTALRLLDVASSSARTGPELLSAAVRASPDLADFLSAEALSVQRTEVRNFLVETSILDDLTPAICDEVLGRSDSLSVLRELAENQVFTTLVDPAVPVYRYHHLFRDFLRGQAAELSDGRDLAIAQSAADLYLRGGNPPEAFRLALAAQNPDMAVEILRAYCLRFVQGGWIETVFGWLDSLGTERRRNDPGLALLTAWSLLNFRRYDEMHEWLAAPALAEPERQSDFGPVGVETHAMLAHWHRHQGDAIASLDEALRAVDFADAAGIDVSVASFAVSRACAGLAQQLMGLDGSEHLTSALHAAESNDIDSSIVISCSGLALNVMAEDIGKAEALADRALSFCSSPALVSFHQPALTMLVKARAARSRGRVGDAARHATCALEVAERGHEPLAQALVLAELARITHFQGDTDASRAHLRAAEELLTPASGDFVRNEVRSARNETRFVSLEGRRDLPLGASDITERELSVLRLLPHGLSRRELAQQLFISENTLKTHLTSLRHKLGVPGRADLAERAQELGII